MENDRFDLERDSGFFDTKDGGFFPGPEQSLEEYLYWLAELGCFDSPDRGSSPVAEIFILE